VYTAPVPLRPVTETSLSVSVVVLGHSGTISLEAFRWLHDIGVAIVQIDADGKLLLTSSPFKETYPRLRRAQACAYNQPLGLEIIRRLISDKLSSQAQLVDDFSFPEEAESILKLQEKLGRTNKSQHLRIIESRAAAIYWRVWRKVEVNFARRDIKNVPQHWKYFNRRMSPLTSSPRNAANPANALLNYLYAILEAETRIACLTVGLDPGLGFLHVDQKNRDSLALDIMEPIRPQVDRWLYEFLKANGLKRRDFFERRDGTVRISSRITSLLAETSLLWAKAVAPVTEWVAVTLNRGYTHNKPSKKGIESLDIATPLTESNRSAGRDPYRRKDTKRNKALKLAIKTCRECGNEVERKGREFCSKGCWEKHNEEVVLSRLADAGAKSFAKLHASGKDPSHGGEAARKRGQSNARRAQERREWERMNTDVEVEIEKQYFVNDLLPKLRDIPVRRIVNATGLSIRYASMIRRGLYTPHPMHYQKLEELVLLYNQNNGG